jgi:NAD(P)H-flavin reductase
MYRGEKAELTGPFGNAWADFLPDNGKKIALVGGGVGIAPLSAFFAENPQVEVHVYAGFKNSFSNKEEETAVLGAFSTAKKLVVSAEYGMSVLKGRIVDFFDNDPNIYGAVFTCGPQPMMKAVKAKCEGKIPCFVSLERNMACGVGACLGCTVQTPNGNRRCCADGPIFDAKEINL